MCSTYLLCPMVFHTAAPTLLLSPPPAQECSYSKPMGVLVWARSQEVLCVSIDTHTVQLSPAPSFSSLAVIDCFSVQKGERRCSQAQRWIKIRLVEVTVGRRAAYRRFFTLMQRIYQCKKEKSFSLQNHFKAISWTVRQRTFSEISNGNLHILLVQALSPLFCLFPRVPSTPAWVASALQELADRCNGEKVIFLQVSLTSDFDRVAKCIFIFLGHWGAVNYSKPRLNACDIAYKLYNERRTIVDHSIVHILPFSAKFH